MRTFIIFGKEMYVYFRIPAMFIKTESIPCNYRKRCCYIVHPRYKCS